MFKKMLYFVVILAVSANFLNAQVVGKLFDADYANKNFGEVKNFVEITNSNLKDLLEKAGDYIMFNINNGTLRALNGKRESILGSATSNSEVFYKMSTSQVYKLIEKGGKTTTRIEMRPKTLTVTNGSYTLELTMPCPPKC